MIRSRSQNRRQRLAFLVASLIAVGPASAGTGRLVELELQLSQLGTGSEADTLPLGQIYDELLGLVTLQVDGVAHPPATLELCHRDEDSFYNPCGLRYDPTAAEHGRMARIPVTRGSRLVLGATHPGAKRLRERTNDWVVVLQSDEALDGKPVSAGSTYWNGDGRLEVDHLGPQHRYLQVTVSDPDRTWREKLTWILDRGPLPPRDLAPERRE